MKIHIYSKEFKTNKKKKYLVLISCMTPCRLETREKMLRISMAVIFASFSADPAFNPKYDATVDIKLLNETERVSEIVMI